MVTEPIRNSTSTLPPSPSESRWSNFSKVIDALTKIAAAAAVVWAAFIANNFQSSITAAKLQSERELADSNLRASMFRDLVGPLTISENTKTKILHIEQEQLLVELLALNFHEQFELKPLMKHLYKRIDKKLNSDEKQEAKRSLQSVAYLIAKRQVALISKVEDNPEQGREWNKPISWFKKSNGSEYQDRACIDRTQACIYTLEIYQPKSALADPEGIKKEDRDSWYETLSPDQKNDLKQKWYKERKDKNNKERRTIDALLGDMFSVYSPDKDKLYNLGITIEEFEYRNDSDLYHPALNVMVEIHNRIEIESEEVEAKYDKIEIGLETEKQRKDNPMNPSSIGAYCSNITKLDFPLTWFEFPFIDNTLLADGTRFSIIIDDVKEDRSTLKLICRRFAHFSPNLLKSLDMGFAKSASDPL